MSPSTSGSEADRPGTCSMQAPTTNVASIAVAIAAGLLIGRLLPPHRFYSEYTKKWRMSLMVIAPTRATLPRIERFLKEYDKSTSV